LRSTECHSSFVRHLLKDLTRRRRRCTDMLKANQHVDESKSRQRQHSPAASVSSSQQDIRTGSSMSTSGSSEPTDIMSPVIDNRTNLPPPMPDNAQVCVGLCISVKEGYVFASPFLFGRICFVVLVMRKGGENS